MQMQPALISLYTEHGTHFTFHLDIYMYESLIDIYFILWIPVDFRVFNICVLGVIYTVYM